MDVRILRVNFNRYRGALITAALLAVLGLVAAGCGGSSASSMPKSGVAGAQHSTSSVVVKTRKIKGLGVVLVNAKGRTLYTFAPDQRRHVTCTGQCARYWPPLKLKGSSTAKAGGAVKAKLLGSDRNPAGGRVATYDKWPLYTYLGDSGAGQANGQNTKLNGVKWYVISPSGKVVKHSA
jgi:predicted lipoprotein with Yx(FWY)xxD motif